MSKAFRQVTDNSPSFGDDFRKADQYAKPMTDEEIKAEIEEVERV